MDPVGCEARPANVVTVLDRSDPRLLHRVSRRRMEVCDEIRYGFGYVPCGGKGGVCVWCLCDRDLVDVVFVADSGVVYPFALLSDIIWSHGGSR